MWSCTYWQLSKFLKLLLPSSGPKHPNRWLLRPVRGGNKRLQHAGDNQSTRRHIQHLTIHICDSLNAGIYLCARNASMLSTINDNAKSIRSRVICHLQITLINDNPTVVPTIINSQNAHVHTWHVIFGPAVGWNSHKNMHLNKPSTPHPSPSAMFTTTCKKNVSSLSMPLMCVIISVIVTTD